MQIKLFKPFVSPLARRLAEKTLLGTYLGEGPLVKQFEKEFGQKFGFKNVVAVNACTSALELAYDLAGLKEGDEVITPVFTCTATNVSLARRKVKIVFADIEPDLNIKVEDVKRKITAKTKAIVFVHFGGNNRGLKEILALAKQHNLLVIEDAAAAVGSDYWGKADFTCVSLGAIKTLTSVDGGFLMCKKITDYKKAKRLRWHGYDRDLKHQVGDTDLVEAGYKFHMSDVTAAIGLGNLRSLGPVLAHRKRLAAIYQTYGLFAHAWLAGGFTRDYKRLKAIYAKAGIEIDQHHYRNDKYTIFQEFKTHCPVMDRIDESYFFVPNHFGVSLKSARKIGEIYKTYET